VDSGKGHQVKNQCFASNTFHSIYLTTSHTVHNCEFFHHCSYGHDGNTEADLDSIEEEDTAFHEFWIQQIGTEKDVDISS
jgi:hypothetical protein